MYLARPGGLLNAGCGIVLAALTLGIGAVPVSSSPASPPSAVALGKGVYASLDCNTCHIISMKGTAVGPELTHVGKTWTVKTLKSMIRHPRTVKPKGYMPAYDATKITSAQLTSLATCLASMK
jgi:cytochrome c2